MEERGEGEGGRDLKKTPTRKIGAGAAEQFGNENLSSEFALRSNSEMGIFGASLLPERGENKKCLFKI